MTEHIPLTPLELAEYNLIEAVNLLTDPEIVQAARHYVAWRTAQLDYGDDEFLAGEIVTE